LWRKSGNGPAVMAAPDAPPPADAEMPSAAADGSTSAKSSGPRLNPIKLRKLKERRGEIEEAVTRLEAEIADYERELANFVSVEETTRVNGLLDARRKDLENLMAEWEEVANAIETNS